MARDATIHVAVRDDIKEKFKEIADGYGMTMSALASFIIGQWVYNHRRYVDPMISDIQKIVTGKIVDMVKDEKDFMKDI